MENGYKGYDCDSVWLVIKANGKRVGVWRSHMRFIMVHPK